MSIYGVPRFGSHPFNVPVLVVLAFRGDPLIGTLNYSPHIIMLTLTYNIKPLSLNALYRSVRGRNILSKPARDMKQQIQQLTREQYTGRPLAGPLAVTVKLYFEDNRRRDVDNYCKLTNDVLTGIIWNDDSQINKLTIEKHMKQDNNKFVIEIVEIV